MYKVFIFIFALFCLTGGSTTAHAATDTMRISLQDAEAVFLQKNLSLIAARYNIDINKALVAQAKLWDNPVLATDQNIFDGKGADGKFFRHSENNGQVFIQVTQLIKTAGKRSKLAQLANDNTAIAAEQFNDVMRSLRYQLRSDLLEINHQLKTRQIYNAEILQVQRLVAAMDLELNAGNIALKDNLRVKALLFNLQSELISIAAATMPAENEVKLLLRLPDTAFVTPVIENDVALAKSDSLPPVDSLIKSALENRPEARLARVSTSFQQHNLAYQRALAKPDITIGTEYDQHSSYNPNYVGLSVALPIPVFNRNQGNIKSAAYSLQQQQALNEVAFARIANEVSGSFDKLRFYEKVNSSQQLDFAKKYETVFNNMLKSYQARQISLLEFLDFADAYKDTRIKLLEQQNSLLQAQEELNYAVNSSIINIR